MDQMIVQSIPALQWWRHATPDEILANWEALRDLLVDRTGFADPEPRLVLTRAAQGEADAQLAVADILGPTAGDLAWSWVALAAAGGSALARVVLMARLTTIAFETTWYQGERRQCRRALVAWARQASPELCQLHVASWRKQLSHSGKVPGQTRPSVPIAIAPVDVGRPSMTVIHDIPLTVGNDDDRALLAAWKSLTQPLMLKGGDVNLDVLQTVLEAEYPWMEAAVAAVIGDLRLRLQAGKVWARVRPTLLVGPPGNGKTSFAKRVATLLGLGYGEISAGGSSDNRALAGTARGWGTVNPSFVLHVMRASGSANPLILINELDQAGGSRRNGDIKRTLLSMLEPVTARAWPDEALLTSADLSQVNWLATANSAYPLRGPLLTRLRVVETPAPRRKDADAVTEAIQRQIASELEVDIGALQDLAPEIRNRLRCAIGRGTRS